MCSSREGTPDWISAFKVPSHSSIILSTDSDSSFDDNPLEDNIINKENSSACEASQFPENNDIDMVVGNVEEHASLKNPKSKTKRRLFKIEDDASAKRKKNKGQKKSEDEIKGNEHDVDVAVEETIGKSIKHHVTNSKLWALSSDSESCSDDISIKEVSLRHEKAIQHNTSQIPKKVEDEETILPHTAVNTLLQSTDSLVGKYSEDNTEAKPSKANTKRNIRGVGAELEVKEETNGGKCIEPHASNSRMPLLLAEKVHFSKALVECEGESIELSGDMGSVGRVVIPDTSLGTHEMLIDLKGTIYKTTIVPSRTFCVVSVGQSEAKIEAVMNDFIQLKPQSNVYDAETIVEGTVEGFAFDSEDENDKKSKNVDDKDENIEGENYMKASEKIEKSKKFKSLGVKKVAAKGRKKGPASKKGKAKK